VSAVCTRPSAVVTQFTFCSLYVTGAEDWKLGQGNWVRTDDLCVYTADTTQLDSTRQDKFSTCSVSKFSSAVVGSRRELVANSIHTTDATPTRRRRNSTRQLSRVGVGGVYWAYCIRVYDRRLIFNNERFFCVQRDVE